MAKAKFSTTPGSNVDVTNRFYNRK